MVIVVHPSHLKASVVWLSSFGMTNPFERYGIYTVSAWNRVIFATKHAILQPRKASVVKARRVALPTLEFRWSSNRCALLWANWPARSLTSKMQLKSWHQLRSRNLGLSLAQGRCPPRLENCHFQDAQLLMVDGGQNVGTLTLRSFPVCVMGLHRFCC